MWLGCAGDAEAQWRPADGGARATVRVRTQQLDGRQAAAGSDSRPAKKAQGDPVGVRDSQLDLCLETLDRIVSKNATSKSNAWLVWNRSVLV